jgi:hypothetical protein
MPAHPAIERLYEHGRRIPPHDQSAARIGSLNKGDDLLKFFCIFVCCGYTVIEADRHPTCVTLCPVSGENEIGNVECQSSDMAFTSVHQMADDPPQIILPAVAVISAIRYEANDVPVLPKAPRSINAHSVFAPEERPWI